MATGIVIGEFSQAFSVEAGATLTHLFFGNAASTEFYSEIDVATTVSDPVPSIGGFQQVTIAFSGEADVVDPLSGPLTLTLEGGGTALYLGQTAAGEFLLRVPHNSVNGIGTASNDTGLVSFTPVGVTGDFLLTDVDYAIGDPLPAILDIPLVCFEAGTLIATATGEVAVETLAIGDVILTADGRHVPVRWLGRQTVHHRFGPAERLAPVVIGAGALAENVPHTDLGVTADHGLILDGCVVHAGALVNGDTIARVPLTALPASRVVYHVETEGHEAILANGAAAETFIDNVTRNSFDNHAEYVGLYGDTPDIAPMALPRAKGPRQVPVQVKRRIAKSARACHKGAPDAA